jgi:hypothetical protein
METITMNKLARSGCTFEARPGQIVVFDRAAEAGGVSMPSGLGATEEEAREDARRTAEKGNVPPESLDGPAYLVIA